MIIYCCFLEQIFYLFTLFLFFLIFIKEIIASKLQLSPIGGADKKIKGLYLCSITLF